MNMKKQLSYLGVIAGLLLFSACPPPESDSDSGGNRDSGQGQPLSSVYYTLSVTANGQGNVDVEPVKAKYREGEKITLTALAKPGYEFTEFTGDVTGTRGRIDFKITKNSSVTAHFESAKNAVNGFVVSSHGGSVVSGAQVNIKETSFSAVTDANGYFTIPNVPAGSYELVISKTGHVQTRVQDYRVTSAAAELKEILLPVGTAGTPPTITVTGMEKDKTYTGIIPIAIKVLPGSSVIAGGAGYKAIYLKTGSTTGGVTVAESDTDTLNYSLNTELFAPGACQVTIASYDSAGNRAILTVPFFIAAREGLKPAGKIDDPGNIYYVHTMTYGESLNYRDDGYSDAGFHSSVAYGSPADCTVLTDIWFYIDQAQSDETAIKIYRSSSLSGPFVHIGTTTGRKAVSGRKNKYTYADSSVFYIPGKPVYYRFSKINAYGEGNLSQVIKADILPKYNLVLDFPGNGATTYDPTPCFYWKAGSIEGRMRHDYLKIYNQAGTKIFEKFLTNKEHYTLKTPLEAGQTYTWNVTSYFYIVDESERVIMQSFPGKNENSNNGPFTLTVSAGQ